MCMTLEQIFWTFNKLIACIALILSVKRVRVVIRRLLPGDDDLRRRSSSSACELWPSGKIMETVTVCLDWFDWRVGHFGPRVTSPVAIFSIVQYITNTDIDSFPHSTELTTSRYEDKDLHRICCSFSWRSFVLFLCSLVIIITIRHCSFFLLFLFLLFFFSFLFLFFLPFYPSHLLISLLSLKVFASVLLFGFITRLCWQ